MIDILIIHLGGEEIIKNCIRSIKNNSKNFNIYLLLNNCKDNSEEIVKKEYKNIKIFKSDKTLGFSEGCNFLVRKAKSKYVVLLNNDTVVTKNWIIEMSKIFRKDKNCAIVQPKIRSYFNKKYFEYAGAAGGYIDKYGYPFCRGRIFGDVEEDKGQYDDEVRIFWGCGACLMVDRLHYLDSGGFDEDFYMYAEELDFCWRTNLYGKRIYYAPASVIYHIGSFSINKQKMKLKKEYLISRNHLLLLLKNYSLKNLIKIFPTRLLFELISSIRFFPIKTAAGLMAILALPFKFIYRIIPKRRIIQSRRILKDDELMEIMYPKSIVVEYFINKKKEFKEIWD